MYTREINCVLRKVRLYITHFYRSDYGGAILAGVLLFAIIAVCTFYCMEKDRQLEYQFAIDYCQLPDDMTYSKWKAIPSIKRDSIIIDCNVFRKLKVEHGKDF